MSTGHRYQLLAAHAVQNFLLDISPTVAYIQLKSTAGFFSFLAAVGPEQLTKGKI